MVTQSDNDKNRNLGLNYFDTTTKTESDGWDVLKQQQKSLKLKFDLMDSIRSQFTGHKRKQK